MPTITPTVLPLLITISLPTPLTEVSYSTRDQLILNHFLMLPFLPALTQHNSNYPFSPNHHISSLNFGTLPSHQRPGQLPEYFPGRFFLLQQKTVQHTETLVRSEATHITKTPTPNLDSTSLVWTEAAHSISSCPKLNNSTETILITTLLSQ